MRTLYALSVVSCLVGIFYLAYLFQVAWKAKNVVDMVGYGCALNLLAIGSVMRRP